MIERSPGVGAPPVCSATPDRGPVVAVPQQTKPVRVPEDQTHTVIEALCIGLQLANRSGDLHSATSINRGLRVFTDMSYERGRLTRENELMRNDLEWMRNEYKLRVSERT